MARAAPVHLRIAYGKLIQQHRVLFVSKAQEKRRIVVQHEPTDNFVTAVVRALRLTA